MSPALIAALPFLGAILAALAGRAGRNAAVLAAAAANLAALLGLLSHAPAVLSGTAVTARVDWVPALGLSVGFRLDGLALLFAGLILGIGLLILLYARFYLSDREPLGRFLAFLLLFQGAMTGIVLADNLLLLLVFWELTSLTSFLLIGWSQDRAASRQGARMALAVTGGGGLALLAGLLLLGQIAGTTDLADLASLAPRVQASPLALPALILILIGAFTKSAQFPFHFWLPQAMAAPTPVSAYLHSATMVKAGLYLIARLWPTLSPLPEWTPIVATTGLATLLIGAAIALFQHDLKALLAYSTVSHLGLITFLLGLGTPAAAQAALLHILAHASFKAALFMLAGIVEHSTHSRDLRRLGGLARPMPLTFALAAVAGLSMAGLPPLNGFLSKEAMLTEAAVSGPLVAAIATLAALLSVAYSLRLLAHAFLGQPRAQLDHPHDPGPGLWAAPALLVGLVVASGLAPQVLFGPLLDAAAAVTIGGSVRSHLTLWHGFQAPALWLSLAAFGAGLAALGAWPRLNAGWNAVAKPDAKTLFTAALDGLTAAAHRLTEALQAPGLPRSLAVTTAAALAAGAWAFLSGPHAPGSRPLLPVQAAPLAVWTVLIAASLAAAALHRDRLLALLLTGITGLLLAAAFAWASAPDLALTQVAVEVVTVLLMLLALAFLPRLTPRESRPVPRLRDLGLAAAAALATGSLSFALMTRDPAFPPISAFHWAQSLPGAGGSNAVNTIIVDFRGFDTYGEIIVLGIAALILFALAETLLAQPAARARLAALDTGRNAGDPHPVMTAVALRFLLPVALTVALYLYLRGHNLPGGGFVAGLVTAIALLLQYVGSGHAWSDARRRFDPHALIAGGVLIATATGAAALGFGLPFLTSGYSHIHLPGLEDFELASAMLFDLGVFLCVLGAVMLSIATVSRLAQHTGNRGDAG